MRFLSLLQLAVAIFAVGQTCIPIDVGTTNAFEEAGMLEERVNMGDIE